MAKKGIIQLQADVYTDDDWDKLLDKVGLIVIDVYSDWCGQCTAMSAILKKLKLEIGGDLLHIAAAKCDNIKVLERFRDKSEPTWMFISDHKLVHTMFGANAPKLIATITNELRREKESRQGLITRSSKDPNEPCGEEQERYEKKEALDRANMEAEEIAAEKKLRMRREEEAEALMEQFKEVSVLLAWPHAMDKALEIMQEQFEKYGLSIGQREKPIITDEDIEVIEYFADGFFFPEESKNAIVDIKTMAWIIKGGEDPSNIGEVLKAAVYGPSKMPPGDSGYPAYILRDVKEEIEETDEKPTEKEDDEYIYGLWCPPNSKTKAMAIKVIFKHLANTHLPVEPEPIPPHIAIAFDAFKRKEVMALVEDYPKDVMRFGFFTDENTETAQLIAKTMIKFEKIVPVAHTEKLIIQLSKKLSDPVLAFAQLGPSFMSTNSMEGEKECKLFFPKDYDIPDEEEVIEEVKKPKKKKKNAIVVTTSNGDIAIDDTELGTEDGNIYEEADEMESDERTNDVEEDINHDIDDIDIDAKENSEGDIAEEEIIQSEEQGKDEAKDDGVEITDIDKSTNTLEVTFGEIETDTVEDDIPLPVEESPMEEDQN